jgi:hypothetical protein
MAMKSKKKNLRKLNINWLYSRRRLVFDASSVKSICMLRNGVPLDEIPNVEPNGMGNSCFLYMRTKFNSVVRSAKINFAFLMLGFSVYVNYFVSLYVLLNDVSAKIMQFSVYAIMFELLFVMLFKGMRYERVSCDKSYVNCW